jgi:hypothetical protein
MASAIQDLINMRDIDSLYEVMTENDDFMYCLDAAEGLVMLGDKRGIEFLTDAALSEDEDISTVAQEILDSPQVRRLRDEIDADKKRERQAMTETARKRIQQGKKVFLYKTVYLPAGYFISSDPADDGDRVDALNEFGFEGWQVAAFLGNPGAGAPVAMSGKITGGYFLIQKEISADDVSELDEL